ncbi:MAG TPA: hypothetical protein PK011_04030 [Marinagarivorans sp.]|nr:hypothetical protein [Marinagarivorans sp.]
MKRIQLGSVACFLTCALSAPSVFAFKLKTHMWVGQQVINDLEDNGRIDIQLRERQISLPVREEIKAAILNNKQAYLMGNIGPDASPDVIVGQTVVHPGVPGGWKTNDWLKHLLVSSTTNPTAKAYTYGYLGHASADVFAHTYVNQYSGDIFELFDGETLVEKRHVMLEGFIEKYTPPLTDYRGNALGPYYSPQNVQVNSALATFLRNALIYDPNVQYQYKLSVGASHLAGVARYRNRIQEAANSEVWKSLDAKIVQLIASYYEIPLSDAEAKQIIAWKEDLAHGADKIGLDNLERKGAAVLADLEHDAANVAIDNLKSQLNALHSAQSKIISLEQQVLDARAKVFTQATEAVACDILDDVLGVDSWKDLILPGYSFISDLFGSDPRPEKIYVNLSGGGAVKYIQDDLKMLQERAVTFQASADYQIEFNGFVTLWAASDIRQAYEARENMRMISLVLSAGLADTDTYEFKTYTNGSEYLSSIEHGLIYSKGSTGSYVKSDDSFCHKVTFVAEKIDGAANQLIIDGQKALLSEQQKAVDAGLSVANELIKINDAKNQILIAAIELKNIFAAGGIVPKNPMQALLQNWVNDIDQQMSLYVQATAKSMINTMDPSTSAAEPLVEWFKCFDSVFLGVPQPICTVRNSIADLNKAVGVVQGILAKTAGPAASELYQLKENLIKAAKGEVEELAKKKINAAIPPELKQLIDILEADVDDQKLNDLYSSLESESVFKSILLMPNVASA